MDLLRFSRFDTQEAVVLGMRDGWVAARLAQGIRLIRTDADCERGERIEVLMRDGEPIELRPARH